LRAIRARITNEVFDLLGLAEMGLKEARTWIGDINRPAGMKIQSCSSQLEILAPQFLKSKRQKKSVIVA
jgi:hypothetical protein